MFHVLLVVDDDVVGVAKVGEFYGGGVFDPAAFYIEAVLEGVVVARLAAANTFLGDFGWLIGRKKFIEWQIFWHSSPLVNRIVDGGYYRSIVLLSQEGKTFNTKTRGARWEGQGH